MNKKKVIYSSIILEIIVITLLNFLFNNYSYSRNFKNKRLDQIIKSQVESERLEIEFMNSKIFEDLEKLYEIYDNDFFIAVSSLEEIIKPNLWKEKGLSSDQLDIIGFNIKKLASIEKTELLKQLSINLDKSNQGRFLIRKIRSWCIAKNQFDLFIHFETVNQEDLVGKLYKLNLTRLVIEREVLLEKQEVESLSSFQLNQAIYQCLNLISSLEEASQVEVFISLYRDIRSNY